MVDAPLIFIILHSNINTFIVQFFINNPNCLLLLLK